MSYFIEHRVYGQTKDIDNDKLRIFFSKFDDIEIAILFGSRANGTYTKKSDYDIGVLGKKDFIYGIQAEVLAQMTIKLGIDMNDIDIVDLKKMDKVLKDAIKKNYIPLKGSKYEISRLFEKE